MLKRTKLLLCIVLLLFLPVASEAVTAHVKNQSARVSDAGHTTQTLTVTGGMTNTGDTVVGHVSWFATTSNLTGVTVCGNTATLLDNPICRSTSVCGATYVFANVTSGACNVVATWNANVTESRIIMHEVSGVDTVNPVGASHAGNAQLNPSGTDSITSTAIVPPDNGRYIFGGTANGAAGTTATAGTGFTGDESTTTRVSEHLIQGTAASIAATFTTSTNESWVTFIVALKDVSSSVNNRASFVGVVRQ